MSIEINDSYPLSTPSPKKRSRLSQAGEIEGYLSLIFPLWLLIGPRILSRYSIIFYHEYELIGMGISIGLALGAVRFGYSLGKNIGWLVLIGVGSLATWTLLKMICLVFLIGS